MPGLANRLPGIALEKRLKTCALAAERSADGPQAAQCGAVAGGFVRRARRGQQGINAGAARLVCCMPGEASSRVG